MCFSNCILPGYRYTPHRATPRTAPRSHPAQPYNSLRPRLSRRTSPSELIPRAATAAAKFFRSRASCAARRRGHLGLRAQSGSAGETKVVVPSQYFAAPATRTREEREREEGEREEEEKGGRPHGTPRRELLEHAAVDRLGLEGLRVRMF